LTCWRNLEHCTDPWILGGHFATGLGREVGQGRRREEREGREGGKGLARYF